eukprot:Colp12_sorted_trinity150504_noHs@10483
MELFDFIQKLNGEKSPMSLEALSKKGNNKDFVHPFLQPKKETLGARRTPKRSLATSRRSNSPRSHLHQPIHRTHSISEESVRSYDGPPSEHRRGSFGRHLSLPYGTDDLNPRVRSLSVSSIPLHSSGPNQGSSHDLTTRSEPDRLAGERIRFQAAGQRAVPPTKISSGFYTRDSKGPLPEGWEMAISSNGCPFYVNHAREITTWLDPRTMRPAPGTQQVGFPELEPDEADLPPGYEKGYTREGIPYYINHNNQTTSWDPPSVTRESTPISRQTSAPVGTGGLMQMQRTNIPSQSFGSHGSSLHGVAPYTRQPPLSRNSNLTVHRQSSEPAQRVTSNPELRAKLQAVASGNYHGAQQHGFQDRILPPPSTRTSGRETLQILQAIEMQGDRPSTVVVAPKVESANFDIDFAFLDQTVGSENDSNLSLFEQQNTADQTDLEDEIFFDSMDFMSDPNLLTPATDISMPLLDDALNLDALNRLCQPIPEAELPNDMLLADVTLTPSNMLSEDLVSDPSSMHTPNSVLDWSF